MVEGEQMARPSGTVAFVFTDIVGSTRLWGNEPEAMAEATARHDELARTACASHGGYVFATGGDSFAMAFSTSTAAVDAAVAFQERLASEPWPTTVPIAVRIGINLGEATERGGDYFGPAVNLAARVEQVAHPGQTLVTTPVAAAIGHETVDLGFHSLKDIPEETQLHQVGTGEFPQLRTLARVRHSLPVLRTATVGRDDFISTCRDELRSTRLLTLTGVGGTGKTRAAVEIATAALHEFPDGVFFADLTAVDTEDQLWPAVQHALGLVADGDARDRVVEFAGSKRMLIVWDNCEQIIDEVADAVDDFLESAPTPTILATSRENLDVAGERVIRVPGLGDLEAQRLFVARAHDAGALIESEGDHVAIAAICEQLDGMPLAIELAAARCASMTPREIAGRLDERFTLLGGGAGRRRRRQQTLAGVMDWSHQLLSRDEQVMFRRLGVFVGGFDQIDVAAVCGFGRRETDDLLQSLIAKSLVDTVRVDDGIDLRLLESSRLYALDRLVDAEEAAELREAHTRHFGLSQIDLPLDEQRNQSNAAVARELCRAANTAAAVDHLLTTDRRSEAAAVIVTRPLGFQQNGTLSGYRDLFLEDHTAALTAVRMRVYAGSGVWAANADYGVLLQLAGESRRDPVGAQIPPGSEALTGWIWLAAMTEGVSDAVALADELLTAAGRIVDPSPSGYASIQMSRAMGLSMLGDFVAAREASIDGFARAPASTNGQMGAAAAVWFLVNEGETEQANAIADSIPPDRPGGFGYLGPLTAVMARIGVDPDVEVAAALIDLCADLVPHRVPSQEGDFLPAFVQLRLRRGEHDRAREIVDDLLVRLLGAPGNHLISTVQGWTDDERQERALELVTKAFDPIERRRRQDANIERLAEEIAHWKAIIEGQAAQAEMSVPE